MPQEKLVLQAPAKINLTLRILGRRPDGYHLLSSHMQKIGLYDVLEIALADQGIHLSCAGEDIPLGRENIVYRTAALFFSWLQEHIQSQIPGVELHLQKHIPVAAGMGGGSSDAAATLLGLNFLCETPCSPAELAALGLQLGADVPFFIDPSPAALATGIGEILQPVTPLQGYRIVLVNPGFSVSTRWVYQTFALTGKGSSGTLRNSKKDLDLPQGGQSVGFLVNDLEKVTLKKYQELGRIRNELLEQGASGALMSGSGATMFGLFAAAEKAAQAVEFFRQRYAFAEVVDPVE